MREPMPSQWNGEERWRERRTVAAARMPSGHADSTSRRKASTRVPRSATAAGRRSVRASERPRVDVSNLGAAQ